ncbi:hypothetical protein FOXG_09002 [Fusarium oxysporum f. sp. lycopersici 4287]|nr:hypothetical protein FOXG_09002 [Fusarium oxysporum f. sp. lycopersici 4287]EXK36876.1 hypothetical protein FOMG_07768 [Fusarium oxysporum f. sp. melonis 26406]KNB07962.1 hypothetical protein FOXG_09002 [Fusarium oxysporum f. sp. lycopersici 4287]
MMAPNQEQSAFDHSKADFTKDGPRRVHMEEFFRHLGLWNPDQVKAIRKNCEEDICVKLQSRGFVQVGQAYFEYIVDRKVWYSILGNANVSFDDHPWPLPLSATPPMKDFSHGVCRFYQGWLLGHQSTREPQGESSEALKSEDLSKDTVTPGLAPAQPAEVTEISTCQTVPTVAPKATIKYDPALPFAQQAKVAAPTKTESDSRTASLATKTVAEMASSPVNSTVNSAQFSQWISEAQVLKEEVAGLKEQMRKQQIEIERLKRAR